MRIGWLLTDRGELPEGSNWLTPEEDGLCQSLRCPNRQADWRLGRWTAKKAAALWLGEDLPAGLLSIRPTPEGAPEVYRNGAPAPLALERGSVVRRCEAEERPCLISKRLPTSMAAPSSGTIRSG